MKLLVELNREGKTVIIVTHEEEIAAYTNRVITLRDGLITDDRRRDTLSILESFKIALSSIWNHKIRSILTMLGIIIGVGAVIIIVAIGEGAKKANCR